MLHDLGQRFVGSALCDLLEVRVVFAAPDGLNLYQVGEPNVTFKVALQILELEVNAEGLTEPPLAVVREFFVEDAGLDV